MSNNEVTFLIVPFGVHKISTELESGIGIYDWKGTCETPASLIIDGDAPRLGIDVPLHIGTQLPRYEYRVTVE